MRNAGDEQPGTGGSSPGALMNLNANALMSLVDNDYTPKVRANTSILLHKPCGYLTPDTNAIVGWLVGWCETQIRCRGHLKFYVWR